MDFINIHDVYREKITNTDEVNLKNRNNNLNTDEYYM